MNKIALVIILVIFILPFDGYGQIKIPLDTNYVCIPGTRICLFSPEGFFKANKFAGIKNPQTGAFIMVSELESPLPVIDKVFTKAKFLDEGMILLDKKVIDFETNRGLLYKASKYSGGVNFGKWILILGDDSSSIMINGTFPTSFDSEISNEVEGIVLSAILNNELDVNPEESVGFYINAEGTKLKFAKFFGGTLIYTVGGVYPANNDDPVSFKVGSSLGIVDIDNPREYALQRLYNLPYDFDKDPEILNIKINDLSGYEIIAYGIDRKSSYRQLVYQVILFGGGSYYLMVGTAYNDFENNLSLFIDIASSFNRKARE